MRVVPRSQRNLRQGHTPHDEADLGEDLLERAALDGQPGCVLDLSDPTRNRSRDDDVARVGDRAFDDGGPARRLVVADDATESAHGVRVRERETPDGGGRVRGRRGRQSGRDRARSAAPPADSHPIRARRLAGSLRVRQGPH